MSNILKYLGAVLLAAVLIGSVYLFVTYNKYQEYEMELKVALHSLFSVMGGDTEGGIKLINTDSENIDIEGLKKYAALGTYYDCPARKGNEIEISSSMNPVAKLDLLCRFENSDARIRMKLVRVEKMWNVIYLSVSSDIFKVVANETGANKDQVGKEARLD